MAKKTAKRKPWNKMTTDELAEATKQFEKPIRFEDTKPLSKQERERFESERRGPAINIFDRSARKREVLVKLDERTLERCEAFASKHRLTLSQFVNLTLSNAIQFAD